MTRIGRALAERRANGERALVIYLTAGDPSLETSRTLVLAAVRAGADIIELGVPFSDPSADGPVLQAASQRALEGGTTIARVFGLVRELRAETDVAILLFGYYNPIFVHGEDAFAREAAGAGADGLLVVDLPPEEAGPLRAACDSSGLDLVPLLAPTSTDARIDRAVSIASGFVYFVSITGVTGAALADLGGIEAAVAHLRARAGGLPIAVGFGIATPEDAARIARIADAVVVGSAAVRTAASGPEALAAYVASLAQACRNPGWRRGG
ncbi:MAG: tryptophan synthase subunit alpha [Deltaproteobacteria bacterium]|nr:tryptophan synthase subunit alpha [Deltaproteobacteria bacterium]